VAGAYVSQSKYAEAEPLYYRTLEIRRRVLGPEYRDTMETAANLAQTYQAQGKFAASESLAREVMEIHRRKQPDGWQQFRAESLLGASLAGQTKYAEAEPLLLAGYRGMKARKNGMEAPDRHSLDRARAWIVQLYQAWGKPREAARWMTN
jgi:eukaryotic-like serine/threonine-protein kinase